MAVLATSFQEFLAKKKIDHEAFEAGRPELFGSCLREFDASGPQATEYRKLFFWNDIRSEFPLKEKELKED